MGGWWTKARKDTMSIECGICERDLRGGHASDCPRKPLTPLKRRIVDMLAMQPRQRMCYYDMGTALWPPHLYPRAGMYSSNGGPPGWAMPLGRALRELTEAGILHETRHRHGRPHGDVVLLKTPNAMESWTQQRKEKHE